MCWRETGIERRRLQGGRTEGGQYEDKRSVTEKKAQIQGLRWRMRRKAKRRRRGEGGGNERGVHAQHELRTLHRRRVRRSIKGTEGVGREYVKYREREIVTVEKGKGGSFVQRTRRMRSKKEQLTI